MVKLLTALGMLVALVLTAPGAHAVSSPSAAECPESSYAPLVPTEVEIEVDGKVRVGRNVTIRLEAKANTGQPVTGTLEVTVKAKSNGAVAASTRTQAHSFTGSPMVADFGKLPRGSYDVTATFTPDDDCVYAVSQATESFDVVAAQGVAGATTDSTLPNTGGPSQWWLLLALLLVSGGAGAIAYARRRSVMA